MKPIQEVFQGFLGGLGAGLIGYVVGVATGAVFEAFAIINPLIPILGVAYAIVNFFIGIEEAYLTGVFFSCGIVAAGLLLNDFVTAIAGSISIFGFVFSFLKGLTD